MSNVFRQLKSSPLFASHLPGHTFPVCHFYCSSSPGSLDFMALQGSVVILTILTVLKITYITIISLAQPFPDILDSCVQLPTTWVSDGHFVLHM